MDTEAGEFMYETIFTNPDPSVIEVLTKFTNRNEMWPYLPCKLDKRFT